MGKQPEPIGHWLTRTWAWSRRPPTPLNGAYCNALLLAHWRVCQTLNHISSVQLLCSVHALTRWRRRRRCLCWTQASFSSALKCFIPQTEPRRPYIQYTTDRLASLMSRSGSFRSCSEQDDLIIGPCCFIHGWRTPAADSIRRLGSAYVKQKIRLNICMRFCSGHFWTVLAVTIYTSVHQ